MQSLYIKKHEIGNFAGFKDKHVINLNSKGPCLILGINGSGKTSLLNSIYGNIMVGLSSIVGQNFAEIGLSQSGIHNSKSSSESFSVIVSSTDEKEKEYEIGLRLNLNGQISQVGKHLSLFKQMLISKFNKSDEPLPVVRYFQGEKLIQKNQTYVSSQKFNKIENRRLGYNQHANVDISIQQITSFFIDQLNIENKEKIANKNFNYETIKGKYIRNTLNEFAKNLYGAEMEILVSSSKFSNGQSLVLVKGSHEFEFIQLSSGEQYVISMVLELIYRNVMLNPSLNSYENTPGVVLIDEVEDHLHPKWQLTILKALTESFKNFQFIVASHSPLIASSVRNDQIIALSNFQVIPSEELPDVYSGSADELLRKILFADVQINDFDVDRKHLDRLIDKFEFEQAECVLLELKEKLRSSPKWINDYERKISFGKR